MEADGGILARGFKMSQQWNLFVVWSFNRVYVMMGAKGYIFSEETFEGGGIRVGGNVGKSEVKMGCSVFGASSSGRLNV